MDKGSPVSSAFSYPWLVVLIAGAVAVLGAKLFSHQDPSLKSKGAANPPGGSGSSRVVQPVEKRDQLTSNSRKLSDEEMSEFLRGTVLEKVEIVDKSLDEAVAILRKEIRKAVPNGPVAGIQLSEKWPGNAAAIKELRLKKVPLKVAIKYLCEVTGLRYWIEDGSVVLYRFHWLDQDEIDRYMAELKVAHLEIADSSLPEALKTLGEAFDQSNFHGAKLTIVSYIRGGTGASGQRFGESVRVHDLKLTNASASEILREFCKQTNMLYFIEENQIFFQPIMHVPVE